ASSPSESGAAARKVRDRRRARAAATRTGRRAARDDAGAIRACPARAAGARSLARAAALPGRRRSFRRRRRLASARLPLALDLVEPPLDCAETLLERLESAHPPLQVVDAIPHRGHRSQHTVRSRGAADALDRLLAGIGEPFHDVSLSGPSHLVSSSSVVVLSSYFGREVTTQVRR